jgi:hypothetical protein
MGTVEKSIDDILDSLAFALAKNLPMLRRLASKPKHVPADDEYLALARQQLEHLKLTGVERIIRRSLGAAHSWPPRDPPAGDT